jgi:Cu+-exporting ATPase
VTIDGTPAAIIAVVDPIKPNARDAVEALRKSGFAIAMITGDNLRTAQVVADKLGIEEVFAEALPDGKGKAVEALRRRFGTVCLVGGGHDGEAAFEKADVRLVVRQGAIIALEDADAVVMSEDPRAVGRALALSQATIRNIKQNLIGAIVFNLMVSLVATGALYPISGVLLSPALAVVAMAASGVLVLGNSLRLMGVGTNHEIRLTVHGWELDPIAAMAGSPFWGAVEK